MINEESLQNLPEFSYETPAQSGGGADNIDAVLKKELTVADLHDGKKIAENWI